MGLEHHPYWGIILAIGSYVSWKRDSLEQREARTAP